MKSSWAFAFGLLIAFPAIARDALINVAPAGAITMRLITEPREKDALDQAAEREAANPWPNPGTFQILESARIRGDHEWQQAFAYDMGQTFRQDADKVSVPFEYPPNPRATPNGFGIVQLLANAVLRANLPCNSIYSVDSIGDGHHGWILLCDRKQNAYAIALVGHSWKLSALSPIKARPRVQSQR